MFSSSKSPVRRDLLALTRLGVDNPLLDTFVARALRALRHVTSRMDAEDAKAAVSAPTDLLSLLSALDGSHQLEGLQEDPLAAARLRGIRERNRMLRMEGGVMSADEAARELNLTRQAVDKRRKAGRLLALSLGRRGFAYPAWQFVRGSLLPGLERVLKAIPERNAWMQAVYFLSPDPRLADRLPLHELRRGRVDEVLRTCRAFGEHGAS